MNQLETKPTSDNNTKDKEKVVIETHQITNTCADKLIEPDAMSTNDSFEQLVDEYYVGTVE